MNPFGALASGLVAVAAAGCGAGGDLAPLQAPPRTGSDDLVIGQEGIREYEFGLIKGIAVDPQGYVYVADYYGDRLRVFDEDGRFVQEIGRRGNGPGEFGGAAFDVVFGRDGRLYVVHAVEINVFSRNDITGVVDVWDERWRFLASNVVHSGERKARLDINLTLWQPVKWLGAETLPRHWYFAALPLGKDSIPVPAYDNRARTQSAWYPYADRPGGRMLPGLSAAPFEAVPVWDLTPEGTILGGEGDRYILYETNVRGDTVRTFRLDRDLVRVSPEERADSLVALRGRLDDLPVPIGAVLKLSPVAEAGEVGETLPAYIGVNVLDDGTIWVEVWPTRPGTRRFDVLSRIGEWRETVELETAISREYPLVFAGDKVYGVLVDPVTGVQRVGRATIRRGEAPAGTP